MILVVQHETDCPPGLVARPELRADMRIVHPYRGDAVPTSLKPGDALIVLGGEMGAMDDAQYPWLTQTKELIAEAVSAEIPTLLICLGHQLGAVALGGAIGQYEAGRSGVSPPSASPTRGGTTHCSGGFPKVLRPSIGMETSSQNSPRTLSSWHVTRELPFRLCVTGPWPGVSSVTLR